MKKKWYAVIATVVALMLLAIPVIAVAAQNEEGPVTEERPVTELEGTRVIPRVLGIDAPRTAPVGERVTINVFQRGTMEPVKDAGVWALSREAAETLREEMQSLREGMDVAALAEQDYSAMVSIHGEYLGETNGSGQLKHTFDEAGGYLLVAVKRGYIPGFKPIAIRGGMPQVLGLRSQWVALVGETVTMDVFQRGTQEPIEGAGVWALSREAAGTLREEMQALREEAGTVLADEDYEAKLDFHGEFLGRTDKDGELEHAFREANGYLLVTFKRGYRPGMDRLMVRDLRQADEASTTADTDL